MPVVCEAAFRFPTPHFFTTLRDAAQHIHGQSVVAADSYVDIVKNLFLEIALEINLQESETVLNMRVKILVERLVSPTVRRFVQPLVLNSSAVLPSIREQRDESEHSF